MGFFKRLFTPPEFGTTLSTMDAEYNQQMYEREKAEITKRREMQKVQDERAELERQLRVKEAREHQERLQAQAQLRGKQGVQSTGGFNIPSDFTVQNTENYPDMVNHIFQNLRVINGANFRRRQDGIRGSIDGVVVKGSEQCKIKLSVDYIEATCRMSVEGGFSISSPQGTRSSNLTNVYTSPQAVKKFVNNLNGMFR